MCAVAVREVPEMIRRGEGGAVAIVRAEAGGDGVGRRARFRLRGRALFAATLTPGGSPCGRGSIASNCVCASAASLC